MRSFGLLLLVAYACSKQPDASAASRNAASPTPQPSASTTVGLDGGAPNASDAAVAELADAAPPAPIGPAVPKVVLHTGDSMVGGYGGLTKALEAKFKPLGAKFVPDWMTAISIVSFDHDKHFAELLAKHSPDLVILTLGANDVFVPFPSSLVGSVKSVAAKASKGGRECWWITPATWKPDTGITEVIKKNAIGCKVFDSAMLKIARGGDGIHPTNQGGIEWADKFWVQYQANPPAVTPIAVDAGQ